MVLCWGQGLCWEGVLNLPIGFWESAFTFLQGAGAFQLVSGLFAGKWGLVAQSVSLWGAGGPRGPCCPAAVTHLVIIFRVGNWSLIPKPVLFLAHHTCLFSWNFPDYSDTKHMINELHMEKRNEFCAYKCQGSHLSPHVCHTHYSFCASNSQINIKLKIKYPFINKKNLK